MCGTLVICDLLIFIEEVRVPAQSPVDPHCAHPGPVEQNPTTKSPSVSTRVIVGQNHTTQSPNVCTQNPVGQNASTRGPCHTKPRRANSSTETTRAQQGHTLSNSRHACHHPSHLSLALNRQTTLSILGNATLRYNALHDYQTQADNLQSTRHGLIR